MQIEVYDYEYRASNDQNDHFKVDCDVNNSPFTLDIPVKELGHYIANQEEGLFDSEKNLVTIPEDGAGYWCYSRGEWIELPTKALTYTVKDWLETHVDDEFIIGYLRTEDIAAGLAVAA